MCSCIIDNVSGTTGDIVGEDRDCFVNDVDVAAACLKEGVQPSGLYATIAVDSIFGRDIENLFGVVEEKLFLLELTFSLLSLAILMLSLSASSKDDSKVRRA